MGPSMLRRIFSLIIAALTTVGFAAAESIDLTNATVVIREGDAPAAEKIAPTILIDEVARRTGIRWTVTTDWPRQPGPIIAISHLSSPAGWKDKLGSSTKAVPNAA